MFPSASGLVQAILLVLGIGWCVLIIKRLPTDLAELSATFKRYRASKAPHVLATIKDKEGRRQRYQKDCAREFWTSLAIQLFFFWPITIFVLITVVSVMWALGSRIASAF